MKKFITSSALLVAFALLSTGAFAAAKAKTDTVTNDVKVWASLNYFSNACGVDVTIEETAPGKSTLTIYDAAGKVLLTDNLTITAATTQKSYLLADLADGNYTIEVANADKAVKQTVTLSSDESDDQLYSF